MKWLISLILIFLIVGILSALGYISLPLSGYILPYLGNIIYYESEYGEGQIVLSLNLEVQDFVEGGHLAELSLDGIFFNKMRFLVEDPEFFHADEVCIEYIEVAQKEENNLYSTDSLKGEVWESSSSPSAFRPVFSVQPFCKKLDAASRYAIGYSLLPDDIFSPNSDLTLSHAFVGSQGYWYPYDSFTIHFSFIVKYQLLKDGNVLEDRLVIPQLSIGIIGARAWNIAIYESNSGLFSFDDQIKINKNSVISFERPLIYRIIYPLLLFTVMILIISFSLVKSLGDYVQGAAAILFGIYGLRLALIPPGAEFQTFLDVLIFMLYSIFSIALLIGLARTIREEKKKRNKMQSIQKIRGNEENEKNSVNLEPHLQRTISQKKSKSLHQTIILLILVPMVIWFIDKYFSAKSKNVSSHPK